MARITVIPIITTRSENHVYDYECNYHSEYGRIEPEREERERHMNMFHCTDRQLNDWYSCQPSILTSLNKRTGVEAASKSDWNS